MDAPKKPDRAALGPAIQALAEQDRRELGSHLDADQLVAYHERRLAEAEAEHVRDHLALCGECAALLLDLASFSAPEPAAPAAPSREEVERAWRDLAPRLAGSVPEGDQGELPGAAEWTPRGQDPAGRAPDGRIPVSRAPADRDPAFRERASRAPAFLPWALAAALVLVVGLSLRTIQLSRELAQPRTDGVVAELEPAGDGTRGTPGGAEGPVPADRPATLILHSSAPRGFPAYRLAIVQAQPTGAVIWQGTVSQPDALGSFVLQLPPGTLPPGRYHVLLHGLEGSRSELLASYDLTIKGR
jgi:hypothetical protein